MMGMFKSDEKKQEEERSDFDLKFSAEKDFSRNDVLICASHGNIYAIHKTDGSKLWQTTFKAMGGINSLFVTDDDKLIAAAYGRTANFDLMTGAMLWVNKMAGFGYEEVSIVTTPSRILKPKKNPEQQLMTGDAELPPQYDDKVVPERAIVLACSRGKAMGIDVETGETLWTYNCPGGRYNIPVVIVEPPSLEEGRPNQLAYIGAAKWVYCLIAQTGEVVWSVKVATGIFGADFMTLATPWSSRLAAESHSAFSQNPTPQYLELQRQRSNACS